MFGAILGDMVGSPYEFDWNNIKTKDFPLFSGNSTYTDDSVMTLAVAAAFMRTRPDMTDEEIRRELVLFLQQKIQFRMIAI